MADDTEKPQWQILKEQLEDEKLDKLLESLRPQREAEAAQLAEHDRKNAILADRQTNAGPAERLVNDADKPRLREAAKFAGFGKAPVIEIEEKDDKDGKDKDPTERELVPEPFVENPTVITPTPGLRGPGISGAAVRRAQQPRDLLAEAQAEKAKRPPEQIAAEQQRQRQLDDEKERHLGQSHL